MLLVKGRFKDFIKELPGPGLQLRKTESLPVLHLHNSYNLLPPCGVPCPDYSHIFQKKRRKHMISTVHLWFPSLDILNSLLFIGQLVWQFRYIDPTQFFVTKPIAYYDSTPKMHLSHTWDVRVSQQMALHIQSADLVTAALYDVYRSSSHDPEDTIFIHRSVSWKDTGPTLVECPLYTLLGTLNEQNDTKNNNIKKKAEFCGWKHLREKDPDWFTLTVSKKK